MNEELKKALTTGFERLSAWSELLDKINVFPVADGDTGRNLKISLLPVKDPDKHRNSYEKQMLLSARGNSGNIATQFFIHFLKASAPEELPAAISVAAKKAWGSIHNPRRGTMLSVFDSLDDVHQKNAGRSLDRSFILEIIKILENTVRSTPEYIPKLKEAGVIDSGALGIFIFFEGFYSSLINDPTILKPATERFSESLSIDTGFKEQEQHGYCIDMVLKLNGNSDVLDFISEKGESVVVLPDKDFVKIHLHGNNSKALRKEFESMGSVFSWSEDDLTVQTADFEKQKRKRPVHIVTDAAGSLTHRDARKLGISLLESYITSGNTTKPETHFSHIELYTRMREGIKTSTSQASTFERHQCYNSIVQQHEKVLYICVGSAFTGNYDVASHWKNNCDSEDRFTVIDSGAASGKLSISVIATARFADTNESAEEIIGFAGKAVRASEEYVFLDRLTYLAAGGRLSRTSAFFGDMLHMKPIVSPMATGAEKIGVARNQQEQVSFVLKRLDELQSSGIPMLIMLQYSDNEEWIHRNVENEIASRYGNNEIILQPLSLTTGVHTGPGTWAMACIPKTIGSCSFN